MTGRAQEVVLPTDVTCRKCRSRRQVQYRSVREYCFCRTNPFPRLCGQQHRGRNYLWHLARSGVGNRVGEARAVGHSYYDTSEKAHYERDQHIMDPRALPPSARTAEIMTRCVLFREYELSWP